MDYIGIDVGVKGYYIVWYSDDDRKIKRQSFEKCEDISNLLENKRCIIAIDAPSGCCASKNIRRKCECELGIGGYFATPQRKDLAKPWMQSGFKLWEFLSKKGYKRGRSISPKRDNLIEVHPTLIFKKIMNPDVDAKLWISRVDPISKRKKKGKRQRREILNIKFPGQDEIIDELSIDHLDALIAAHTAEQSHSGSVRAFGDPDEGQILFPLN